MRTLEAIELLAGGYMNDLNGPRACPPRRHIVNLAPAFPIVLMHCHVINQIQRSLNGRLEDPDCHVVCSSLRIQQMPNLLETGRSVIRCSTPN